MTDRQRDRALAAAARAAEELAALDADPNAPAPVRRRREQDTSQVYSVRIPVVRLEQLRRLAEDRGVPPTALLRQFVLERLDAESRPVELGALPERDPNELRLGPSRSASTAEVVPLAVAR